MDRKTECQIVNTLWMRKGIFFLYLIRKNYYLQKKSSCRVLPMAWYHYTFSYMLYLVYSCCCNQCTTNLVQFTKYGFLTSVYTGNRYVYNSTVSTNLLRFSNFFFYMLRKHSVLPEICVKMLWLVAFEHLKEPIMTPDSPGLSARYLRR